MLLCSHESALCDSPLFVDWSACINDVMADRFNGLEEMYSIIELLDKTTLRGNMGQTSQGGEALKTEQNKLDIGE